MTRKKILLAAAVVAGILLGTKYLLPILLPFCMGALAALAAEPITGRLAKKIPRGAASGIGVTAVLLMICGILSLLGTLAVRTLEQQAIPEIRRTADRGIVLLEDKLISLAQSAPDGLRPQLTDAVLNLFGGGGTLVARALDSLPGMAKGILEAVPDGALGVGTALISAYLISARLPAIRNIPLPHRDAYRPAILHARHAMGKWLRAQGILTLVTFGICLTGFLILGIGHPLLLAILIALVDAAPVLGTGTVLIPWALILLLQGQYPTAIGLLLLYAVTVLARTVLEPKLLGSQLGLDPLITLGALYLGFRLWGIPGMILTPLFAATAKEMITFQAEKSALDNRNLQG